MKTRSDFVTNSSSSSFVIGKKDDESVTIEFVFHLVKDFYNEYLAKRDELRKYIEEHPEFNMRYIETEDGRYYRFKCIKDEYSKKYFEINDAIKRDFGINTWDYFEKDYAWLDCETYQDYEDYWINKIENSGNKYVHAPFTIADFLGVDKKINWLHFTYDTEKTHDVGITSDVLGWYHPYLEWASENIKNCNGCRRIEWCNKETKKECKREKKFLKKNDFPREQACLYLLGRVCIYSECGYIPDYVVNQLREVSEYSCNHMG